MQHLEKRRASLGLCASLRRVRQCWFHVSSRWWRKRALVAQTLYLAPAHFSRLTTWNTQPVLLFSILRSQNAATNSIMCAPFLSVSNEPLFDWSRFTTEHYETCVPFTYSVQPSTVGIEKATGFLLFPLLPRELQLHVIDYCSQATLYQLMQVSSTTRDEAKQRFWSAREAWYRVEGEWLLAGGFAGHTYHAADFLANVQQVELHFESVDAFRFDWLDIDVKRLVAERSFQTIGKQIDNVWRLLLAICPSIRRVVVSESHNRAATQPLSKVHTALLQRCPTNVDVSGSYLQRRTPNSRAAVRHLVRKEQVHDSSVPDAWTVVNPQWTPQIVLPPHKTFRGAVGSFQQIKYEGERYSYQLQTLGLLRIKATETHYFGGEPRAFTCPAPACTAYFDRPGQWPAHADKFKHQYDAEVPPEFAAEFAAQRKQLERRQKQGCDHAIESMRKSWAVPGTEQRRIAEYAFLSQLEHDPLYACGRPARQTSIWNWYRMIMDKKEYLD